MTYSERIRREMAWNLRTFRQFKMYAAGANRTTPGEDQEAIRKAEEAARAYIAEDEEAGNITKRQAAAARKAAGRYAAELRAAERRKNA